MHNFLAYSPLKPSQGAALEVIRKMAKFPEWVIKQKGIGPSAVHPVYLLNTLQELDTNKAYNLFNRIAKSEIGSKGFWHKFENIENLYDRSGNPVREYRWQFLPENHSDLIENLNSSVPAELRPLVKTYTGVPGNKQRFLDLMHAAALMNKNIFKYGSPEDVTLASGSNLLKVIETSTRTGYVKAGRWYTDLLDTTLPINTGKTRISSFRRNIINGLNMQLSSGMTVGGVAAAAALSAFALTFFNPDQMKSLGHMPGRGGEHWDWKFSTPELAYEKFMQTPLGNPYDLPKTYLKLFDPNEEASYERAGKRKQWNPTLTRMPNQMRGGYYSRNSYYSSDNYLKSNVRNIALGLT
jgi:hypothetical protein